ncbi:exosortase/archaeosortase family protein, partial [Candidatus Micrarchaeota archaeon]|nr:exosortase/archaeosortase family protein [Candidatus Micrarchaeota archaeon]
MERNRRRTGGEKALKKRGTGERREWLKLGKEEKEFLLKFAVLFIIPYVFIHFLSLDFLLGFIAEREASFLNALGYESKNIGQIVVSNGNPFKIIPDCSGLVMIILLFALVYATNIKEPRRTELFLLGALVLFIFNLFRLLLTILTGVWYGPVATEVTHFILWFVDAAVVLLLWAWAAGIPVRKTIQS